MDTKLLLKVIQRVAVNAHVIKNMLEDGKFLAAGRQMDGVIDQLSLLQQKLHEALIAAELSQVTPEVSGNPKQDN